MIFKCLQNSKGTIEMAFTRWSYA